jgi:hypothetical protein
MIGQACRPIHTGLVVLAIATSACASGGVSSSTTSSNPAHLTGLEIQQARLSNAYDAVRYLRPLFLNVRGPTSVQQKPTHDIVVIIAGQVHGGVDELRRIPTEEVLWVRRLTASEVYYKHGRTAPSGGIEVCLVPRRDACS